MLARIAKSSIECREEAVVAKLRAVRARSPELRVEHQRLADKWTQLAAAFDEAARVSGFIEWSAQRLRD
jgi:hypothetical protein